jgi:hypothetical protein
MSDLAKTTISFIITIRKFLEELDDTHLNTFLADWPRPNCRLRMIEPHPFPVLSWMPAAVSAASKKGSSIVNMLAFLANHLAWGQTYSSADFGAEFLEKYACTLSLAWR